MNKSIIIIFKIIYYKLKKVIEIADYEEQENSTSNRKGFFKSHLARIKDKKNELNREKRKIR